MAQLTFFHFDRLKFPVACPYDDLPLNRYSNTAARSYRCPDWRCPFGRRAYWLCAIQPDRYSTDKIWHR